MTIGQAIQRWAPPKKNNTAAYQAFVSRALGLPIETPMGHLNPQQLDLMGRAIQHFEGQRRINWLTRMESKLVHSSPYAAAYIIFASTSRR